MNKTLALLFIGILLCGCVIEDPDDRRITHPDVAQIGASDCNFVADVKPENKLDPFDHIRYKNDRFRTAQVMTGIKRDCVPRRQLMQYRGQLPKGYRVLFLSLGPNDVAHNVPVDKFRARYEDLVYNSDAGTLYCILPNKKILGRDAEPYRQIIREICTRVIDPLDYGVRYRARDTVHLTKLDHRMWAAAILKMI
jgi:hypothetical protein